MICLETQNLLGYVIFVQAPQPSDMTTCPYVLQSGAELASNSPFLLSATEATQIGVAIAILWGTVAAIRLISRRL
jgi:hypothetical protein